MNLKLLSIFFYLFLTAGVLNATTYFEGKSKIYEFKEFNPYFPEKPVIHELSIKEITDGQVICEHKIKNGGCVVWEDIFFPVPEVNLRWDEMTKVYEPSEHLGGAILLKKGFYHNVFMCP